MNANARITAYNDRFVPSGELRRSYHLARFGWVRENVRREHMRPDSVLAAVGILARSR
jgi:hypothetical protein